ncbi:hemolysin family protein [Pseudonocardia endophytica]|uniref:CBS domain containing-hemolysin-like protein n=1 Tax=Pseudonocardia endophytica TaxID=401976 RepID=A0A4R1HL47_PSEEN|nr:hemolysin family protein [Pseudonocardia endophytica]TCK21225.1 CBS domain containing-hemolysin-like protein [Pseudonocardia endophytica]
MTVWLIVAAVVLILLAGIFAAADAALMSISRARVDAVVRTRRAGARALAAVVADRPRHVNLLLLLRLTAETAATVLIVVALAPVFSSPWIGVLLAGVIMVVVSYVLIGVGPRTLGRQHPYRVGLLVAAPVRALGTLLSPLSKLLILVGNAITPGPGFREGPFSTEVELRELVDMASTRGVVDEGERKMIHSVFELGETPVREIMVPRPDVVWAERDTPVDKVLRLALKSGYSRIPVLGEGIDDVIGIAYLKDLVRARDEAEREERARQSLVEIIRPAVFVPDSKRSDELLREMQRHRNHMAVVVDEYGGTAGVVTIEDILEEIVGEIADEYDQEEIPDVSEVEGRTLRVAARLPVEDLEELFAAQFTGTARETELREALEAADVDTVGGLLAQRLGKVPLPGAEAEVAGLHLRGEGGKDARGRTRITSVLVTPLDPVEAGPEEAEPGDSDDAGHALERPDADELGATGALVAPQEGTDARQ